MTATLPTDIAMKLAEYEILDLFPREGAAAEVAIRFVERQRTIPDETGRAALLDLARAAAAYATHQLYSNAFFRAGDMSDWHGMADLPLEELAARGSALQASYRAARTTMTDEDLEREDELDAELERKQELQDRLEDEGFYGRTHPVHPDSSRWIYVRFGRMPEGGRSVFGLAGEDTEDGPDEWRTETGNKTREAGICVLRAKHHPSVPGAYVVIAPDFSSAMYGVPNMDTYLLSIIPRYEEGEHPTVLRIDGHPVTCKARDGSDRLELGSDGEYLIDPSKPMDIHALSLDVVFVDAATTTSQFLEKHRNRHRSPAP